MWDTTERNRKYSVPPSTLSDPSGRLRTTEELHAWSIYRQNLNSDITDSALGTGGEKTQPPFGNFQLRESTVQTILSHPKYGPRERRSELGANAYTYLRFGLPRVMPVSRGHREGSSGYDSSDDGSPYMDRRRARSDPDFRKFIFRNEDSNQGAETSFGRGERRLKASSEANLLSPEVYDRYERQGSRQGLLRSHQDMKDSYQRDPMPGGGNINMSEKRSHLSSKAGSHMSLNSRASRPRDSRSNSRADGFYSGDSTGGKFFSRDSFYSSLPGGDIDGGSTMKHPHLQVRDLSYEMDKSSFWQRCCGGARTKLRLLDGISLEARGGEILAIMATADREGTTLLDILANRHRKWRARLRGEILLNGLFFPPNRLEQCVAYVNRQPDFCQDMSVRQTLLFASLLQEPGNTTRGFDAKGRINALLEDLGLGEVRHTRVKDLTESEKRRLNVACSLLLDTEIVLLDQPTEGMDIFDTFFLVEYLRQWAARGRIVIMTIHPPTYEIFTMISRVALVSTGRMLYFGKRRDMLSYFAYIDFPCPAYKNPSDYYLDLVTLDNLSAEAMLESSQRVENLVDTFRRRQEALSDPGPPGMPPPTVKRANFFMQILALWIRVLIFMFPFNVVKFCRDVFLAALMSVLIGAIYWHVRAVREQANVDDRFGFYYVIMAIAIWPLLLNFITSEWNEKPAVRKDIADRLYWKISFVLSKLTYSLPSAAAVLVAYVVPAYSMAGLSIQADVKAFGIYIGYTVLYLLTLRMVAMAISWSCSSRHLSAAWTGIVFVFLSLTSGYSIHLNDISVILSWFQWVSPMRWMMEQALVWEFQPANQTLPTHYDCSYNPPQVSPTLTIVSKGECGVETDKQALSTRAYRDDWPIYEPIVITVAFHLVFFIGGVAAFLTTDQRPKRSKNVYR